MKKLKLRCYCCENKISEILILCSLNNHVDRCFISCKKCLNRLKKRQFTY